MTPLVRSLLALACVALLAPCARATQDDFPDSCSEINIYLWEASYKLKWRYVKRLVYADYVNNGVLKVPLDQDAIPLAERLRVCRRSGLPAPELSRDGSYNLGSIKVSCGYGPYADCGLLHVSAVQLYL